MFLTPAPRRGFFLFGSTPLSGEKRGMEVTAGAATP